MGSHAYALVTWGAGKVSSNALAWGGLKGQEVPEHRKGVQTCWVPEAWLFIIPPELLTRFLWLSGAMYIKQLAGALDSK